jgi:DNA-binding HxlR family transcriptional regulator
MMAALDLLGRRWTLRVIWELGQSPAGFRELRRRADQMSSSVLAERLRQLTEVGIVRTDDDGAYHLTDLGQGLQPALEPLRTWAETWSATLAPTPPPTAPPPDTPPPDTPPSDTPPSDTPARA